jgi:radical SAM protein with 4Fe4S-binding SPASM domain
MTGKYCALAAYSQMKSERIKLGAKDGLHGIFYHLDTLLKWKQGEVFPPLWVEVGPTNLCNQRCFYCYVDHLGRKNLSISEDLLVKIFQDMGGAGVKCCELQGTGEPLLNKGVPDAIVAGKKTGMDICLVTNGTLLTGDILKKIEPCLSFLRVSALAHDPEFYARLHCCPEEHFHLVVSALKEAVKIRDKYNLDVVIIATFVVFDFNMPYVLETARLLKDIGVNVMSVKPSVFLGYNQNQNWQRDSFHRRHKEKFDATKELEDDKFKVFLNEEYLDQFMSGRTPVRNYAICYGVEFETHIDADAKIYPCQRCWRDERYCLGDLKTKSFGEIWGSREWRNVLNYFYKEISLDKCKEFCCKQHSINGYLYEMANPTRHANVI